jgi:HK97 family phage major capsid protein
MKRIAILATIALVALVAFSLGADGSMPLALHSHSDGLAMLAMGAVATPSISGVRGLIGRVRADGSDPVALIASLNRAFEEFKSKNDERLAQIETKGSADVVTREAVDRINTEITNLSNALKDVETKANRPQLPTDVDKDEAKARAGFNLTLKAHAQRLSRPLPADMNAEGYRAYRESFVKALRYDNRTLDGGVMASLTVGSDPDGGYLCPPEIDQTIDRIVSSMGAMRGVATVRTIGGPSYKKAVTTTAAGFGGWVGETGGPSETDAQKLSDLEFVPGKMWAEPRATTDLLEDASVDVEAWLGDEVGLIFAEKESDAFINGTGINQPRGLLSYTTVANASYAWGKLGYVASGAASDFAASNPSDALIDLVHALKRQYRGGASWIMNDATLGSIRKFKDGQGNYIWAPSGLQGGQVGILLGYPVATDDFMPDVGSNEYPVAFGDFRRGYVVVDRRGTVVIRDNLTAKPYVKFYTTRRVGGGVQNFEAIKLMKIAAS